MATKRADRESSKARAKRVRAAGKYKPATVDLLLVAEAPPSALDRYFYFADVMEHDSLFRYVVRAVLKREPTRGAKGEFLSLLKEKGTFLIDLKVDPLDASHLTEHVPDLVRRCRRLRPRKIILIKSTVYDAAYRPLREAGLPVVDERVPFPGSGQQLRFLEAFGRALRKRPPKATG